jgi:rSAM/selenodomain-associated transferase 1
VLAKAPVPGYAKTRLIPRLGADGAAALHASLVERTLRTATSAGFADLSLWCAPAREHPLFAACQALGPIRLLDQPAGDIGMRMLKTFDALLPSGGPALLIGADCPELSIAHLRDARAALTSGVDAVFIPALDGGYVLVGLRSVSPGLFANVPWGTSDVMAETRARLRELRWSWHELAPLHDLDTPADLEWALEHGHL